MLRTSFLITLLFSSVYAISQMNPLTIKERDKIAEGRLQVVLTGDDNFDTALKSAVEKEVKLFPYDFITESQFESEHENNSDVYALLLSQGDFKIPVGSNTYIDAHNYDFFGFVKKRKEKGKYDQRSVIAFTITKPGKTELGLETELRLYLRYFIGGAIDSDFKIRNKEKGTIVKANKLYVPDWQVVGEQEDLTESYGYPLEFISAEKLKQLVDKGTNDFIAFVETRVLEGPLGDQGIDYFVLFNISTGDLVTHTRGLFFAREDPEKYAINKIKTEKSCLSKLGKNLK